MCAQFMIKGPTRLMGEEFDALIHPPLVGREYDTRVVPFRSAPVVVLNSSKPELREMRFHLTPRWAKEEKVKWATYNARLESVEAKASFKGPFRDHHCLVILNSFIEPIYVGEYAGHMVQFHRTDEKWMVAAGIFDQWTNPQTGEVLESFSILTDEPEPFVASVGHDREPLFLSPNYFAKWLAAEKMTPAEAKAGLRAHRQQYELSVAKDRAMRPGWEKRATEESS